MTKIETAWATCHSSTKDAFLSCAECCAFEYRKCDGCPASAFAIRADEMPDPMDSIKVSTWIDALAPLLRDKTDVAA
jgi:hypothetical protein